MLKYGRFRCPGAGYMYCLRLWLTLFRALPRQPRNRTGCLENTLFTRCGHVKSGNTRLDGIENIPSRSFHADVLHTIRTTYEYGKAQLPCDYRERFATRHPSLPSDLNFSSTSFRLWKIFDHLFHSSSPFSKPPARGRRPPLLLPRFQSLAQASFIPAERN